MNSLEHFGTVAFEMSMMREHIQVSREDRSRLELSRWLAIVPEVYRRSVVHLVRRSFESIRYQTSDDASVYEFLTKLHRLIWAEIKPIAPSETEQWRLQAAQELIAKALAGDAVVTSVDVGFGDDYRGVTRLTFDDNMTAPWAELEFAERMATFWGARLDEIRKRLDENEQNYGPDGSGGW